MSTAISATNRVLGLIGTAQKIYQIIQDAKELQSDYAKVQTSLLLLEEQLEIVKSTPRLSDRVDPVIQKVDDVLGRVNAVVEKESRRTGKLWRIWRLLTHAPERAHGDLDKVKERVEILLRISKAKDRKARFDASTALKDIHGGSALTFWDENFGSEHMTVPTNMFLQALEQKVQIKLRTAERHIIESILDPDGNKSVTVIEFGKWVQHFGPIDVSVTSTLESVCNPVSCDTYEWFFQDAFEEAAHYAAQSSPGRAFVRYSETGDDSFLVTVCSEHVGRIFDLELSRRGDAFVLSLVSKDDTDDDMNRLLTAIGISRCEGKTVRGQDIFYRSLVVVVSNVESVIDTLRPDVSQVSGAGGVWSIDQRAVDRSSVVQSVSPDQPHADLYPASDSLSTHRSMAMAHDVGSSNRSASLDHPHAPKLSAGSPQTTASLNGSSGPKMSFREMSAMLTTPRHSAAAARSWKNEPSTHRSAPDTDVAAGQSARGQRHLTHRDRQRRRPAGGSMVVSDDDAVEMTRGPYRGTMSLPSIAPSTSFPTPQSGPGANLNRSAADLWDKSIAEKEGDPEERARHTKGRAHPEKGTPFTRRVRQESTVRRAVQRATGGGGNLPPIESEGALTRPDSNRSGHHHEVAASPKDIVLAVWPDRKRSSPPRLELGAHGIGHGVTTGNHPSGSSSSTVDDALGIGRNAFRVLVLTTDGSFSAHVKHALRDIAAVHAVNSFQAVAEAVFGNSVDALIVDSDIGSDTIRRVFNSRNRPPVFLVCGSGSHGAYVHAGAEITLSKPVSTEQLVEGIMKLRTVARAPSAHGGKE